MTRWTLLLLLSPAALAFGSPAFADEPVSAPDRALARSLFEQARALAHDGKFADACPKFEESARLAPGIGTSFNLGDCLEHTGRLASAWAAFTDAADQARRAGQQERETAARNRAALLEPKMPRVELSAAPPLPEGFTVALDGHVLGAAVLHAPLPIDAGEHTVRASAPGKVTRDVPVRIAAAPRVERIEIAPLDDEPVPAEPTTTIVTTSASSNDSSRASGWGWQKTSAVAAGGLALIGLGVGSYFAVHAHSQWSDAQASCAGAVCSPAGYSGWQDARSSATVSTALFITGGALAVGGIVLWIAAPSSSGSGEATPRPPRQAKNEVRP